jgi:hypothetical protein
LALISVHLERTVDAVRAALPEDEIADFDADMASTTDDEPQRTFDRWFARAVLNEAGLLADIKAGISHATGPLIPADVVLGVGWQERCEQLRAKYAA